MRHTLPSALTNAHPAHFKRHDQPPVRDSNVDVIAFFHFSRGGNAMGPRATISALAAAAAASVALILAAWALLARPVRERFRDSALPTEESTESTEESTAENASQGLLRRRVRRPTAKEREVYRAFVAVNGAPPDEVSLRHYATLRHDSFEHLVDTIRSDFAEGDDDWRARTSTSERGHERAQYGQSSGRARRGRRGDATPRGASASIHRTVEHGPNVRGEGLRVFGERPYDEVEVRDRDRSVGAPERVRERERPRARARRQPAVHVDASKALGRLEGP